MQQPQPGDALATLDTPAMLVDLDLMQSNLAKMMERFKDSPVKVRPHLKTVKSPHLARRMMSAGAVGGCVAKISEAEVMAEGGVTDLLITTELAGAVKLNRLVALLQRWPALKLRSVVDSIEGATALNNVLAGRPRPLEVLIDLNVGQNRTGVPSSEAALTLAQQLKDLPNLKLVGVQGYEGHLQHVADADEREKLCRAAMQKLVATANQLREAGFDIQTVTTGGTGTAEICASCEGVTEVQPGSFIFMDTAYRKALGPVYANALTIWSTVVSRPAPNRVVIDAGLKSLSTDSGFAEVKGLEGVKYRPGGDEHGILEWQEGSTAPIPAIGERVELIPSHIDTTVNLHDNYYAHRDGKIAFIWPVATRGKVQ